MLSSIHDKINYKLQAGALQYTMLVSFIVVLTSGFLILSYYLNGKMVDDQIILQRLHTRVESAINHFISAPESSFTEGEVSVQPFEEETEPIKIQITNWGAYKVLTATGEQYRFSVQESVMIGTDILKGKLPAIYLTDNKRYLTVSGRNIIVGDCQLPKYGVDRGRFAGEGFIGKDAVVGRIKQSDERLPEVSPDLLSSFKKALDGSVVSDSTITASELDQIGYAQHSFFLPTVKIEAFGVLRLNDVSLLGNILIVSDTMVDIGATVELENVIVAAPYIRVQSGFSGNAQLVASQRIEIGDDCTFYLPSSAVLLEEKAAPNPSTPNTLTLGKGSVFAGCMILKSASGVNNRSRIVVGEDSEMYGQIYSDNFVEHKGSVYGSIFTNKFYRSSRSDTYYNLLSNSVTDISKLPKSFLGASIFDENLPMDIIEQVY